LKSQYKDTEVGNTLSGSEVAIRVRYLTASEHGTYKQSNEEYILYVILGEVLTNVVK